MRRGKTLHGSPDRSAAVPAAVVGRPAHTHGQARKIDLAACGEILFLKGKFKVQSDSVPGQLDAGSAGSGPFEQQLVFAGVAGERSRSLELHAGFYQSPELLEQVAPHTGQQV